jgi:hypothetical protein
LWLNSFARSAEERRAKHPLGSGKTRAALALKQDWRGLWPSVT